MSVLVPFVPEILGPRRAAVCTRCYSADPLAYYHCTDKETVCNRCWDGEPLPVRESEERKAIRAMPYPDSATIRVYHLLGFAGTTDPRLAAAVEEALRWKPPEAPPEAEGLWVGQQKERVQLCVRVDKVVPMGQGDYGDQYLALFTDTATGARLTWFTGENCWCEDGWVGEIKATVKDHVVYRGLKQTALLRVKKVGEGQKQPETLGWEG